MDLEELWCADCGAFVGYMIYCGPHGSVLCGPCGQKSKNEGAADKTDAGTPLKITP